VVAIALVGLGLWGYWYFTRDIPEEFASDVDHYKYGSIGAEREGGIPYSVWKVMPRICPDKLPRGETGYESFGFVLEPGRDRPIGWSSRILGVRRVGMSCSVCHTGTYRETPASQPRIVLGMPPSRLDLQAFTHFMLECSQDERFTVGRVWEEVRRDGEASWFHAAVQSVTVPVMRRQLKKVADELAYMGSQPKWGPGRVDDFNPVKAIVLKKPFDNTIGYVDPRPAWYLQRFASKGGNRLWFHWDGNNRDILDRDMATAVVVGAQPEHMDLSGIRRIELFLTDLPVTPYPFPVDQQLAAKGKAVFDRECASCHAPDSELLTEVVPIEEIGTDPHRLEALTPDLLHALDTMFIGGQVNHPGGYRKTNGYSRVPLDGLWACGPYLHNGSVPTLWDLLQPPEQRPKVFYRGYDVFDQEKVGFISSGPAAEAEGFRYDTSLPGNGNQGHTYGTNLSVNEKKALLEYLKSL